MPTLLQRDFALLWSAGLLSNLIMANLILAVLTIPLLVVHTGQLWLVYVAVFALNLVGLVIAPAENALLPSLVSGIVFSRPIRSTH